MAKILIAIPAFSGCDAEVTEAMMRLTFHLGRREPEHEFFLKVIGKKEQFRARNALVNIALGQRMDYIWFLDDDMIVPPEAFGKLMAHGKRAIGGLYYQRNVPYGPVVLKKKDRPGKDPGYYPTTLAPGLHEVDVIGGGCMLLDMKIFDRMVEPYFTPEYVIGTDVQVCQRFQEMGVPIYADTSVILGHMQDAVAIYEPPVDFRTKRYSELCTELCEDLVEWTGKSLVELGDLTERYLVAQESEWNAKDRSTQAGKDAYYTTDFGMPNLIRFVHYNMNDVWKIQHNEMFMETGWLRRLGINKILDYGCGASFLSVPLARDGFDVTVADLEAPSFEFVKWRSAKHVLPMRCVTIPGGYTPKDLIICTDVYEHMQEDWACITRHIELLKVGGYLCTNAHLMVFKTADEGCPQHLRTYDSKDFINRMEGLGMELVPPEEMQGHAGFFKKVR